MTVRWLEASLTDQLRFTEARSYFPPCYSQAFHDCIESKNLQTFPNCARMKELWTIDTNDPVYKQLDAEVQKLPYCPAPAAAAEEGKTTALVVGAVALVLGLIVGRVLT